MDERKEDGEVERRVCSVERRVERLVDHRRVELLPPERELRDDVPAPSDGLSAPCKTDYIDVRTGRLFLHCPSPQGSYSRLPAPSG